MTKQSFIFGIHAVLALLEKNPERIVRLCRDEARHDHKMESLLRLAKEKNVVIEFLSRQQLDETTQFANHQGILAFCTPLKTYASEDLKTVLSSLHEPPFLLILDGIQDPHNLGACFRTADAAGVHAIIAPKDKAVGITPIVSKVASGATETIPFIQVTNLVRTIESLKESGIWIYGASASGKQSLYQSDLKGPLAFVLGAEGAGLRRLTEEHCDVLVHIPMHGSVSSLNVSVATGIALFEAVRQRQTRK